TSAGGLVLVLDDLHWADHSTRRLLDRVAAEVRRMPMLILCTRRENPAEAPAPVAARATAVLSLRTLSTVDSAAILSAAIQGANAADVRRGVEISGGSPLYRRTLTRVAASQLRGQADWAEVGRRPELRHLIVAALGGAGEAAMQAVTALSVLGPEADPDLLAR